jgi:hypothetical protein
VHTSDRVSDTHNGTGVIERTATTWREALQKQYELVGRVLLNLEDTDQETGQPDLEYQDATDEAAAIRTALSRLPEVEELWAVVAALRAKLEGAQTALSEKMLAMSAELRGQYPHAALPHFLANDDYAGYVRWF